MTALDDAIARARRQIAREESPIRRRLWLAYRDALEALDADLVAVTRMIVDARAAGIDVSPDWLRRQARYRMLIADAEREFARFADLGIHIVREGQAAAVSGGAHSALELVNAAGVSGAVGFGARINVPAVERLVAALLPGSPVHDVLAGYGPMAAKTIEDALVAGVIEGAGPREVVRTIRRGIASGTNQARLEALVRTEYMRAFRGSLGSQLESMRQPGDRWKWSAAKSSRTCLSCLSLDGRTFNERPTQFHINCRCVFFLVPAGVDLPYESGPDWFARQSAETQRKMMPSDASYQAWKNGDVTLDDFRGTKRSRVWGVSYVQRSGAAAIERGKRRAA